MLNKTKLLTFSLLSITIGFITFSKIFQGSETLVVTAAAAILVTFILIDYFFNSFTPYQSTGGVLGSVLGLVVASLVIKITTNIYTLSDVGQKAWQFYVLATSLFIFYSLGEKIGEMIPIFQQKGKKFFRSTVAENHLSQKVLDTSVIIDGRIVDLCETGFIEGIFLLPQFVLIELQHIADSSDSLKRARGKRGLDVLDALKKMSGVSIKITEEDFPSVKEVDSKLIALAKKIHAKVVTNDLNLNKVAELQGVKVLNINDLCNALKPIVLPGETMAVFVLKEGKEAGQGIAYLDDGTMIVVDDARKCIGKSVEVLVTSILQTTAGRMIFTKLKQETSQLKDNKNEIAV